jgi:O-Antigen ligase
MARPKPRRDREQTLMQVRIADLSAMVVALTFAGYPLVAGLSEVTHLPNIVISVVMRGTLLAIAILVLVMSMDGVRRLNALTLALVIVLGAYGVRLLYQTTLAPETLRMPPGTYWIWYLGTVVFPVFSVMFVTNLDSAKAYRLSYMMFVLAAIPAIIYGSTVVDGSGQTYDTGRVALLSLNPISVGNLGACITLLSLWVLFGSSRFSRVTFSFYFIGLVMGACLLFIASSRGPIFSTGAAALVMGVGLKGRTKFWFFSVSSIIFTAIFLYFVASGIGVKFSFVQRLLSLFYEFDSDGSNVERFYLYSTSIQQIFEAPLFGSSIENQVFRWDPHNLFLEIFMALGLFGGLLSVFVFPLLLLRTIRLVRQKHPHGGMAILFVNFFIGAQFSGNVYSNGPLWVSAMIVAISRISNVKKIGREAQTAV